MAKRRQTYERAARKRKAKQRVRRTEALAASAREEAASSEVPDAPRVGSRPKKAESE